MKDKSFVFSKTNLFAAALAILVQFQDYIPMLQDLTPVEFYTFIATWVPVAIVVLRALTNSGISLRLPFLSKDQ